MIGTKARWMTGALVSAGLMLGSVSAAEARPRWDRGYDRGWDRHHHRHGDDGFGVGDAIGVAALVGAVAIVANSLSKDRKVRDPITGGEYDAPPPSAGTDYGADVADAPAPVDEGDFSDIAAQDDAMTDACARAARDEAQQAGGGYAEIRTMASPVAGPDGGYNIDGEVEQRAGYRAAGGETRRFTCTIGRDGRVAQVYLSRDLVSR